MSAPEGFKPETSVKFKSMWSPRVVTLPRHSCITKAGWQARARGGSCGVAPGDFSSRSFGHPTTLGFRLGNRFYPLARITQVLSQN